MSVVGDFLPGLPKRWKLMVGAVAAYYAAREVMPQLFEKSVSGQVAVVTGAGSGIGRLIALRLAKEGCQLALWDINREAVEAVVEECKKLGVTARAYVCNVADREAVYASGKDVENDFGRVDILVNNAGIVGGKKLLEADDNRIELTLKVNTLALIWVTKAFLPGMLKRNQGHVVNVASSAGRVGVPGLVDYCASKFGAVGFDESLRLEMKKIGANVHTTCVCPMYIKTGMFLGAKLSPPNLKFLEPVVNFLMPLLEPEYVANEVVNAMKRNQQLLVMPAFSYTTTFFQAVLPTTVCDRMMYELGVSASMDDFKQTRPT